MNTLQNYQRWLNSDKVDLKTKEQLKQMTQAEIDDAFFKDVEFGTAGMRGVLGPGTNRLNIFTVKKATVAFAIYLLELFPNAKEAGVVISHDNRHMSRTFTLLAADVLNDFGIKTYIFDSLRPTPELSFAVRFLKAIGGIMITASHNPKQYNGYKVYDETGCQLVPAKIARLLEIISTLPNELDVAYEVCAVKGETILLDSSVDDEYVRLVESISINRDLPKNDFTIVFTPNHGASYVNSMRIFQDLGYKVYPVLSQINPDPDFSGTLSPNPEDPRAYIEPIKLAKELDAALIVMTDPDGDRVGIGFKSRQGEYLTLNGNQSAALLMDYIFSQRKEKGLLSENGVMYNTIVTSALGKAIATYYGVKTEQFLTGFKYIGNRIDYYEKTGNGPKFEFGYEESYGCLIAPFARDKDGCQAILMYCEMALFYFLKGLTLEEAWDDLCKRFGYYQDITYSMEFTGSEGQATMQLLMKTLHNNPFIKINGLDVVAVDDYLSLTHRTLDKETPLDIEQADVIKLHLSDGSVLIVRPSGTEPKVKFYIGVVHKQKPLDYSFAEAIFTSLKECLKI
ncbi:MAG: phospho-sugar mutase [Erysipelotrichaceae bacterium]|jgi:phosphoglucomutase|nr:phospho-sugar mutase [Erysipelotrichaceae bacterium]